MFQPTFFLKNRHLQTLYPTLMKKNPSLKYSIEEFTLSDGDFLELFWYKKNLNKKIVILLHGLGGSYRSPYIPSLMQSLYYAGFSPVLVHFRGCGTKPNNLPRSYHSGDTGDISEVIDRLAVQNDNIFLIGFSLGANVALKYLAEKKDTTPVKKAIAVSTPFKLDICSTQIDKGFAKIYQYRLLQQLKSMLLEKKRRFELPFSKKQIQSIQNFWEFDALYTAPIHGFKNAKHYYDTSSSYYILKKITTPTLLIHAEDDPFMTPEVLPKKDSLPAKVTLQLLKHGGHVGFVSGSFFKPCYWLDRRITEFLNDLPEGEGTC